MSPRLTKIVCTLGPSSQNLAQIQALAESGMNVARINLSHGSAEEHARTVKILKEINSKRSVPIGILFDTKGADIRTGDVEEPIPVKKDSEVVFSSSVTCVPNGRTMIYVDHDGFADDVKETDTILIDNGELSFDILSIDKDGSVLAKAREDGEIGSRRHVNLPGADLDMPSITKKDWEDIAFAVEQDADFLALSFIRNSDEVNEVRKFLNQRKSSMQIITKVETAQAIENIAEIVDASDGIMIARGDLGAEVPYEKLPALQIEIIVRCSDAGKPVIVATHMLESMKEHAIPTRAEMTDVANAAMERTDATMLSGETASGKHPNKAIEAMDKLLVSTESNSARFVRSKDFTISDDNEAKMESVVSMADSTKVTSIIAFTQTGRTARLISKFRPDVPVIACTEDAKAQKQMTLMYGVSPLLVEFSEDPEVTIQNGIKIAKETGLLKDKDTVVLVSDVQTQEENVWSVQTRTL